jgi:hypothetical protein
MVIPSGRIGTKWLTMGLIFAPKFITTKGVLVLQMISLDFESEFTSCNEWGLVKSSEFTSLVNGDPWTTPTFYSSGYWSFHLKTKVFIHGDDISCIVIWLMGTWASHRGPFWMCCINYDIFCVIWYVFCVHWWM